MTGISKNILAAISVCLLLVAVNSLSAKSKADRHRRVTVVKTEPKKSDTGERHIWPCAEDFHEAFDVGVLKADGTRDTKYLAAGDVAGVALAGVKELAKDNRELRERIVQLEALVEALLAQQDGSNEPKAEFGMNK